MQNEGLQRQLLDLQNEQRILYSASENTRVQ